MATQSKVNSLESPDDHEDQKLLASPWKNQPLVLFGNTDNSLLKVSSAQISPLLPNSNNSPFFYGPKSPSNSSAKEK